MPMQGRALFQRFGHLDTWVVGIQYYDGARQAGGKEVFFDRDPDNTFDPNAIAVLAEDGRQIGHLPRYDAAHFSPLILDGLVALKGVAGVSDRGDRLPLALDVYATSKVSEILVPDMRDDWRALYHNLLAGVWARLDSYSPATLGEFRNRFRPLGHDQALYPKTQFLYRMLKAQILEREKSEQLRFRQSIVAAVEAMNFGPAMGWPELSVIPLDGGEAASPSPDSNDGAPKAVLAARNRHEPQILRLLPSRCPYPAGAHGAIVLVHGEWFTCDWFEAPACAQVYWYQMVLAGVQAAMRETADTGAAAGPTSEETRQKMVETLRNAVCSGKPAEINEGSQRIDIAAGAYEGTADLKGTTLTRLHLHEAEPQVVNDAPTAPRWERA